MARTGDVSLYGILAIAWLSLMTAIGWVLNVVALANSELVPMTAIVVLRIIGVVFVPLGAILGWFFR